MNDNQLPENDLLAERLRREGVEERPAFSAELHEQILHSVRQERRFGNSPRSSRRIGGWYAAAAAVLIGCGLTAYWVGWRGAPEAGPVVAIKQPAISADSGTSPIRVDLSGLLSGTLFPSDLTIHVPSTGTDISIISTSPDEASAAPAQSTRQGGLPEMLFAMLQEPATGANGALGDVVPPGVRALADLVGFRN